MREYELISQLAARFARSPLQRNAPFACDAEIVDLGGTLWGITTDAFSPDEDCFGSDEPERIGHNIAAATLSDLFAAGCRPQFYLHALDLPPGGEAFGLALSRGLAAALDACGAFMLGGDLGCGESWRCCATALGPVTRAEPLTRLLPPRELALFVTGALGDANAAALLGQPPPAFELRCSEATILRDCAAACIDTSDGLANALWQWLSVNPGFRFELAPESIPYAPLARDTASRLQLPLQAFLFGGAGEYELLFAADARFSHPCATRIGTVAPDPSGAVLFGPAPLPAQPPDPRDFRSRPDYIAAILALVHSLAARPSAPGAPHGPAAFGL